VEHLLTCVMGLTHRVSIVGVSIPGNTKYRVKLLV
jgi:hypothetical protein